MWEDHNQLRWRLCWKFSESVWVPTHETDDVILPFYHGPAEVDRQVFADTMLPQLPDKVAFVGPFNDVVGVDTPFQRVIDVPAEEFWRSLSGTRVGLRCEPLLWCFSSFWGLLPFPLFLKCWEGVFFCSTVTQPSSPPVSTPELYCFWWSPMRRVEKTDGWFLPNVPFKSIST